MKSVETSLKVFGIYMILIPGMGMMAAPDFMLDLFMFSYGDQLWMARMVGLLAFIIGVFDYTIGKQAIGGLYRFTIMLRYFAALFMLLLWLINEVEIMILLFAAIDAAGATWTWLTISTSPGKG